MRGRTTCGTACSITRPIRICVSEHVADALRETGKVRGPLFTIPAAIDVPDLQRSVPAGRARPATC